ncbi:Scr1 family TA system antitoxin-like transcriptional regulator [Streptomyces sp. NBC_01304]|uniref:Scr1 family TA system antitoxin-like transcriptional regulator n=1 Tax=Streptomyces sp. NBC_01304 TaxID=2903818 RepID=UPI002E14DC75|nr:helix-turn-helix domain-containing protein [Streptomyces sp. NBC_01304]
MSEIRALQPNATIARLLLGAHLERLRLSRGLTQKAVADRVYISVSKLCRIEAGCHRSAIEDVQRLAHLYEASDDVGELLLSRAVAAQGRGTYHSFADVADAALRDYLDVEAAGLTFIYAPHVIPAVLRTRCYARELLGEVSEQEADRRLWLLSLRQQRFFRARKAPVRILLGELAHDGRIGDASVMREQWAHLKAAAVDLRVLPARQAARSYALGAFSKAVLGNNEMTVTCAEHPSGELRLRPDSHERATAQFEVLWQRAGRGSLRVAA